MHRFDFDAAVFPLYISTLPKQSPFLLIPKRAQVLQTNMNE